MPMRNDMPLSPSPQTTYHLGNTSLIASLDQTISMKQWHTMVIGGMYLNITGKHFVI